MKTIYIFLIFSLLSCYKKQDDSKCSKEYLIHIAEVEWLKVYGKDIYSKKPFVLKKKNDSTWVVDGTLPEGFDGGVPTAEISMKTCKVISISHGK